MNKATNEGEFHEFSRIGAPVCLRYACRVVPLKRALLVEVAAAPTD